MNEQLIQKAKTAKSADELYALAQAEGIEMTEEKAAELFQKLTPPEGELSDDELENVAGGGCGKKRRTPMFAVGNRVRLRPISRPSVQITDAEGTRQEVICGFGGCRNYIFFITEVGQDDYGEGRDCYLIRCPRCNEPTYLTENEMYRA